MPGRERQELPVRPMQQQPTTRRQPGDVTVVERALTLRVIADAFGVRKGREVPIRL